MGIMMQAVILAFVFNYLLWKKYHMWHAKHGSAGFVHLCVLFYYAKDLSFTFKV